MTDVFKIKVDSATINAVRAYVQQIFVLSESLHKCKNSGCDTFEVTHAIEKEIESLRGHLIDSITEYCAPSENNDEEIMLELGYGLFADLTGCDLCDITDFLRCCAIEYSNQVIGTKIVVSI